jgi:hypothetical protein
VANVYVTLDTLKGTGALDISGSQYDSRLLGLFQGLFPGIDRFCNRHFFTVTEAREFRGKGSLEMSLPDFVNITALKEDDTLDGTFSVTWGSLDYLKEPANANPTSDWGRPYTRVTVNLKSNGTQDIFLDPTDRTSRNYEITGTWGYRHVTTDSGNNGTLADGTATSLTLDGTANLEVGHTIVLEEEQIYVTALSGTAATVERAKNGSTGTAHTNVDIYVVEYPQAIREAAFIQVARLWKRKDSGFAQEIGFPETGQMTVFRGLDSDVKEFLMAYKKIPVAS